MKRQTQEELKVIYLAWKMGAQVEMYVQSTKQWKLHRSVESIESEQPITATWLYMLATGDYETESKASGDSVEWLKSNARNRRYRIKGAGDERDSQP